MTPGEQAVALARRLIAMDSTSDQGSERDCALVLGAMLGDAGFEVRYFDFEPGRTGLAAYRGNRHGRPLCLTGHLDTVPCGAQAWAYDPFGAQVEDGRLYGRGACDMKSGVAALVSSVLNSAVPLNETPGVLLMLTAGEETGCRGAAAMVREGMGLRNAGAIVVAEPTANEPLLGHKGALWLKLCLTGRGAHGSMPERGDNALLKGAYLATHLARYRFAVAAHRYLGRPSLNVGTFAAGAAVNMVPDRAELGVDIRSTPGMRHDEVCEAISRYVQPQEVGFERMLDLPNVWTDERDPWIASVFELMARRRGRPPEVKGASYFTDACVFGPASGNAPVLILGPGEPAMAHQTDEYCEIAQIHEAVAIYDDIVQAWCRAAGAPAVQQSPRREAELSSPEVAP